MHPYGFTKRINSDSDSLIESMHDGHSGSIYTHNACAMRFIQDHVGSVKFSDTNDFWQGCFVSIHAVDRFADDDQHLTGVRLRQQPLKLCKRIRREHPERLVRRADRINERRVRPLVEQEPDLPPRRLPRRPAPSRPARSRRRRSRRTPCRSSG